MSQSREAAETFGPIDAARTSERVADAIVQAILEGTFQPGQVLPPERTLAQRFGVTRNTVREALRALEQSRLVAIRQGSGARVLDYLSSTGLEFLGVLLTFPAAGRRRWASDLAEARTVLGRAICHHAIDHLKTAAVTGIERSVEDLAVEAARTPASVRILQELEFEVHNSMVRGGGNLALILLHNSLRHIYGRVAHLFEPLVAEPAALVAQYRLMAAALRADDRQGARRALDVVFAAGEQALKETGGGRGRARRR